MIAVGASMSLLYTMSSMQESYQICETFEEKKNVINNQGKTNNRSRTQDDPDTEVSRLELDNK